jgi:hypothetical protein
VSGAAVFAEGDGVGGVLLSEKLNKIVGFEWSNTVFFYFSNFLNNLFEFIRKNQNSKISNLQTVKKSMLIKAKNVKLP